MSANDQPSVAVAMRRLSKRLPKSLGNRIVNSLDHFDRADLLFDLDREMASFRAITGEEEAATVLIRATKIRGYEGAKGVNLLRHHHKAAVVACVLAVADSVQPLLKEFQLKFDFQKNRIDLKIPLSAFDIPGGDKFALQPIEPLGMLHSKPGLNEGDVFDAHLFKVSEKSDLKSLRKLVNERANQRNTLLYASDADLPKSRATPEAINWRRNVALAMIVVAVMIYQSKEELPLVRQWLATLGKVI